MCCMVLLAASAGCGTPALFDSLPPASYSPSYSLNIFGEGNYLTYEHAFTDAAAEIVRKNAESLCGQKKQAAVRTSGACSLTRCTTHYYCMDQADAAAYRPQDAKK
jgi:hypothetical protein